jgi:transcriptional regulator with XRE-family HTH domain
MYAYIMTITMGSKIRQLREAKKLSLRELARKLDHTAAHVSDIELGNRFPSDSLLNKIAVLLEVPIEELQSFDTRAPIEALKKLVQADPAYGVALRQLVNKEVSPDDILQLLKTKPDRVIDE